MPTTIVINGGGPAGCVTALRAAKLPKTRVVLLERRPLDFLNAVDGNQRSYTMILHPRGLQPLQQLELDLPSTKNPLDGAFILPGLVPILQRGVQPTLCLNRSALQRQDVQSS